MSRHQLLATGARRARVPLALASAVTLVLSMASGGAFASTATVPRDPGWSADHLLSTRYQNAGEDFERSTSGVAVNSAGAAVTYWYSPTSGAHVAVRDAGGRWSTPQSLGPSVNAKSVHAGIAAHGRTVIVWLRTNGSANGGSVLMWMQRPAGGAWTVPQAVPGALCTRCFPPLAFSMSASGYAAVAYKIGWSHWRVYAQVMSPDGTWRAPARVSPERLPGRGHRMGVGADDPVVAVGNRGGVTAVWEWVTRDDESGSSGFDEAGGIRPDGVVLPVRHLDVRPCCEGPNGFDQAQSRSGRAMAVWGDLFVHHFDFRLADGRWRRYDLPREGGRLGTATMSVTDDSATAWWVVNGSDSSALYTATFHQGVWSEPQIVATSQGKVTLRVFTSGCSADGCVLGYETLVEHPNYAQTVTAYVRSDFAGRTHTYAFPQSTVRYRVPLTVDDVAVTGTHAALTWNSTSDRDDLSDFHIRTR